MLLPIRSLRLAAALVALSSAALGQPLPSSAQPGYKLFVGMDLELPYGDGFHPMRRIVNRNHDAEIAVDGQLHHVQIRRAEALRLKRQLKVGRLAATVDNLQNVRTYSINSDPYRAWVRAEMAVQSQASERADMAQFEYTQNILGGTSAESAMDPGMVATRTAATQAVWDKLQSTLTAAPLYDYGQINHRISSELAQDNFDAFEATFDLTTSTPLADVDLLLVAHYTVPDKPEEKHRVIFTRALGAVSTSGRRERVFVQHLPPGFQLVDTQVFLYSYGEEITTNLSEKSVEVTQEQALQTLQAGRLVTHRQRSAPAEPIWLTAPLNFRAILDPAALPPMAVLRIDADGVVQEVLDDNQRPLPVTGLLRRVLTETRFLPALENGRPVESELRVKLPEFFR